MLGVCPTMSPAQEIETEMDIDPELYDPGNEPVYDVQIERQYEEDWYWVGERRGDAWMLPEDPMGKNPVERDADLGEPVYDYDYDYSEYGLGGYGDVEPRRNETSDVYGRYDRDFEWETEAEWFDDFYGTSESAY